jgi:hypothetical protein
MTKKTVDEKHKKTLTKKSIKKFCRQKQKQYFLLNPQKNFD